jgi:WD40 repeat protein
MNWGLEASYTPDGKFLLVPATNTIRDQPDTKRFLYFYDTTNYQLARQLDITSWNPPVVNDEVTFQSNVIGTALAIAPDSRTMAVAYEKGRQPQVVLYDLETGKEVGRAVHPAVKESREDPFAARIGKLAFTPDGKYLFSSTHDTFVWEVPS